MEIVIANATYREGLYAEITYKDVYWAEVNYDSVEGLFILTIFAPTDSEDRYVFPLTEVQEVLERAKQALIESGYGQEAG